jgi:UDP-GlcNAc:undecaprenyl-phosphate GlcNAc-1-phosphate transferase
VSAWAAIPLSLIVAAVVAERLAAGLMLLARHTGFVDRPQGYKAHAAPTPYLGGAAVLAAALVAVVALDRVGGRLEAIFWCAAILWLIGTIDDRINLAPQWRLFAEVAVGAIIASADLGFTAFGSGALNFGFTILWVVAIVNAFNLMDNIDGACSVVAGISAAGLGAAALAAGDVTLAVTAVAVAGACGGFLRHNMARPAQIFLGDGGSMPLGFLIAALAMAVVRGHGLGGGELCACGLFAGLPVLDTTLVVISRRRRRVNVLTGGLDHLTHRLLPRFRTPTRAVAALGAAQAALVTLAVIADQIGAGALILSGGLAAALGVVALSALEPQERGPALLAVPAIAPLAHATLAFEFVPARRQSASPTGARIASEIRRT